MLGGLRIKNNESFNSRDFSDKLKTLNFIITKWKISSLSFSKLPSYVSHEEEA